MSVKLRAFDESDLVSPFDDIEWDAMAQTGGDWYATMLSASLGGKDIEGAACSGSSEVLMKVDYEFAAKKATGTIRFKKRDKEVEALDIEGNMVAKTGKKYRGIPKANNFSLITEDTLWSSAGVNRVRSAAFLSASLVGMGVEDFRAADIASDVLGETLPPEVMEAVVVPLSMLKRDAAVLAKGRSSLFTSHHITQDVIWEDGALVTTEKDANSAIDWGRITTLAKYIGVANSLADPRFAQLAEHVGVPYAMVDNHWAVVTSRPYRDLCEWTKIGLPAPLMKGVVDDIAGLADTLLDNTMLSVATVLDVSRSTTAGELLRALEVIKIKRRKPIYAVAPGTDVLQEVIAHSVNPGTVGITVQGAQSSHNALKSAQIAHVQRNEKLKPKLTILLAESKRFCADEGLVRATTKELVDALYTAEIFSDAKARLARELGSEAIANQRMATYRRKLFRNSSALSDKVVVSSWMLSTLSGPMISIAKAVLEGKTGILLPPPILANPAAAIASGETLRLLAEATKYYERVRDYWKARYKTRADTLLLTDRTMSIKYSMAASAVGRLEPTWLVNSGNEYLPADCLDQTYIAKALEAYTRKRSGDAPKIKPMANESAMAYAKRMDDLLQPSVSFVESMKFASSKIKFIAEDFKTGEQWKGEPVAPPAPVLELGLSFMSMFGAPMELPKPTEDACRKSWVDFGDAETAAKANGYEDFHQAYMAISDKCIYDPYNDFTKKFAGFMRTQENKDISSGETQVI